jgi:TonB-dependent SusC/RagA subfamily outer membrane receptor
MSASRAILPVFAISFAFLLAAGCASTPSQDRSLSSPAVTAEDIERNPGVAIEYLIQRKVPGVNVKRAADGSLALQIRGSGTLLNETKPPLVVVDDQPIHNTSGGTLPTLDRSDIESIRVLKGADAAIYGIDGANGVIIITLKKGT